MSVAAVPGANPHGGAITLAVQPHHSQPTSETISSMQNQKEKLHVFTITENGFTMNTHKVAIPHCRITAHNWIEAASILTEFLKTKMCPETMELITPFERIDFDSDRL
jgi:hypothetical protein